MLLDFLWQKGLLTTQLAASELELAPDTALFNRHLTDTGYYFLQSFLPKWQDRMYKHASPERERAVLERWYRSFVEASSEPA